MNWNMLLPLIVVLICMGIAIKCFIQKKLGTGTLFVIMMAITAFGVFSDQLATLFR